MSIFIIMLSLSFSTLYAQTKDDVVNTYNKGVEQASTDVKAAVATFMDALKMAEAVGADADDIKQLVESQLPALQNKYASELANAKNYDEAIVNFEKAIELAQQYGDEKTEAKAKKILPQIYFSLGNSYYKKDDFENALSYLDNALKYKPDYAKVYLIKGLAYKKQGSVDEMLEALDLAIENGNATDDTKTANTAGKVAGDFLLSKGNKAVQAGNYDEAIELLNRATNYEPKQANTYYLLTVAHNKTSNWDASIAAANEGLTLEDDTNDAKAKFFFELGNAYMGKGDNASACSAFKNAAYGNYTDNANYQIETVLKCE